jgi:hypothetical protein
MASKNGAAAPTNGAAASSDPRLAKLREAMKQVRHGDPSLFSFPFITYIGFLLGFLMLFFIY